MVMSRERKAKKGLEGGACWMEVKECLSLLPFLGFLCGLRQVFFELGPGSHHASCPTSCPATLPQVSGDKRGAWEPNDFKGECLGDLSLLRSLAGLCLVFMSFQARRGTVSKRLGQSGLGVSTGERNAQSQRGLDGTASLSSQLVSG